LKGLANACGSLHVRSDRPIRHHPTRRDGILTQVRRLTDALSSGLDRSADTSR